MHNLHDDVFNAYFLLKEYVGGKTVFSDANPFSMNHKIMLLDPYEATDSSNLF